MAKKHIETQIEIDASPETIWHHLTNFSAFPEWNPFLLSAEGNIKEGSQLKINAGGMKFNPTVQSVKKGHHLQWKGKLLFNGLFDGEHRFEIVQQANGKCLFKHSEKFNGILVGLFAKKLDQDTLTGFQKMNEAMKLN